ncbi:MULTISPECIES: 50S ribosomal protein L23 [Methylophaga]|jgi:large subunit ribosomal protein L23|uniref:Large ribosomal subunit protein uL23 n=1 Tax=Methylophaga nitratireducenticrescens TaxID=754476 RepID=I1XL55_METNJ|nr:MULTISPECIES: 50S ribosomal protein L23 [Methylophaga]AFI85124.1 50S ribosomal protein L23 [Methylophaga nitratireducenticrescens]AUZ85612.1 50S ribosomal protein L23 [Methylophaga nitratireducenticrescens]MAP25439.1 50S ribosomal protein L23 [Methylophaga sp.]MBP25485.1 50S ribosomal protein L23 [Methylophaga sp.]MCB2425658.1 50S ribosomal protein L23 [Methylophaga pinxianii]|tara:strand:- start:8293 stop:8586 length:294 start_codon:yes stop_codon:yes gene_type:complete
MNTERLSKIILGPVVAEKASRVAEDHNQVVLKVLPNANKAEIKKAVESLFDVKVAAVSTANVKGKVKRVGRSFGKRSDWKKAYVTLADGADLNFLGE